MECNFYNSNLDKIGIMISFVSMSWQEQYSDKGSFVFVTFKDENSLQLLKKGHFVGAKGFKTLMYIYSVETKNDQLWAYGAESKVLLQRKIYDGALTCRNVESTLKQAVSDKNPFPFVEVAQNKGLSAVINSQRSYSSLFDLSKAWCDSAEYGFTFNYDKNRKKLVYDIYNGNQVLNTVFAEKYGNLYKFKRVDSEKNWANVAYVAGAGDGAERRVVVCGETSAQGLNRSEIYVDARDIQRADGQSDSEYDELLKSRGLEKLTERKKVNDISFQVETADFGTAFKLGDLVPFISPDTNEKAFVRINGFTKVFENNKIVTKIQIGEPILRSETT